MSGWRNTVHCVCALAEHRLVIIKVYVQKYPSVLLCARWKMTDRKWSASDCKVTIGTSGWLIYIYTRSAITLWGTDNNHAIYHEFIRYMIFFYGLTALVGHGLLFEIPRSESDTPRSLGLLWTSDRPVAETSTWQHTTFTRESHPCPCRDSNPQRLSLFVKMQRFYPVLLRLG